MRWIALPVALCIQRGSHRNEVPVKEYFAISDSMEGYKDAAIVVQRDAGEGCACFYPGADGIVGSGGIFQ